MILLVALFLFLICETTLSFVFYFTGFLLIITLVNIWYLNSSGQPLIPQRKVNKVKFSSDSFEKDNNVTLRKVVQFKPIETKQLNYYNHQLSPHYPQSLVTSNAIKETLNNDIYDLRILSTQSEC